MSSLNQVTIMGNLGRDPEVRETQNGSQMATMSIATSERYKDRNGERQESTEWHRVVVFNEALVTSVIQPYLRKGASVLVQGKLRTRQFEQDGQTRYMTEVVLQRPQDQLVLNGRAAGGDSNSGGDSSPGGASAPAGDDEIPF